MSVRNRFGTIVLALILLVGLIVAFRRLDLLTTLKRMHGMASLPIEVIGADSYASALQHMACPDQRSEWNLTLPRWIGELHTSGWHPRSHRDRWRGSHPCQPPGTGTLHHSVSSR